MTDRRADAAQRLRDFILEHALGEPEQGDRLADLEALEPLPELMGTAAVAETLGTTTANLRKWSGIPAPLYDLPAGKFYDADAIREEAARRRREGAAA